MSYLAVSIAEKGKKVNSYRPRKGVWWSRRIVLLISTSVLGGSDWSISRTGRLILVHRGITPNSTHCSGASLGVSDERKI
jgi:hypothetical protein